MSITYDNVIPESQIRASLRAFVESRVVQTLIMSAIILNAVTLGLETSATAMAHFGPWLILIDHVVLWLFVVEITLKLVAYQFRFFRDGWNIFDALIVSIALFSTFSALSVLRAFRVLRVLRLFSMVPQLRAMLAALFRSMPGLGAIAGVLCLVFYVFAVMATNLFGGNFPDLFGSIQISMMTLFQVMTLDGWSSEVVLPLMEQYPYVWLYFIPFILMTSFTVLNLFIALIVNSLHDITHAEMEEQTMEIEQDIQSQTHEIADEIRALKQEIQALRQERNKA